MRLFLSMYTAERGELADPLSMTADEGEQLPFAIEGLEEVEHGVSDPDMAIAIDAQCLWDGQNSPGYRSAGRTG